MLRTMKLKIGTTKVYESSFDPKTGTLVRVAANFGLEHIIHEGYVVGRRYSGDVDDRKIREGVRKIFPWRSEGYVPSPSPETVDISITDRCGFGCDFCYQDSKPRRDHAPAELVETALKGFEVAPYQVAIGGGEPTGHPDFPDILRSARALGTVPNYTTAGHIFKTAVIDATNEVCGGVALTYHSFKGFDWFKKTYRKWREALKVQFNVHLIADKNVVKNLTDLVEFQEELGHPLSIILLAYYPDVGRADSSLLMPRSLYTYDFPEALKKALASGMKIAFSEGLLPFFLSRPEIGVDTTYAMAAEGRYSCYIGPKGHMSHSSFSAGEYGKTIYEASAQKLWEGLHVYNQPSGGPCYECVKQDVCSTPSDHHHLICAYASHNKLPLPKKHLPVLNGAS